VFKRLAVIAVTGAATVALVAPTAATAASHSQRISSNTTISWADSNFHCSSLSLGIKGSIQKFGPIVNRESETFYLQRLQTGGKFTNTSSRTFTKSSPSNGVFYSYQPSFSPSSTGTYRIYIKYRWYFQNKSLILRQQHFLTSRPCAVHPPL
jgi:hypothetical protein